MAVNVTSTLEVRDNFVIGQAILWDWYHVHKDYVEILASGTYEIILVSCLVSSDQVKGLVVTHQFREYNVSLDYILKNKGRLQLEMMRGDRITFMYDDYSTWLHSALVTIRKCA